MNLTPIFASFLVIVSSALLVLGEEGHIFHDGIYDTRGRLWYKGESVEKEQFKRGVPTIQNGNWRSDFYSTKTAATDGMRRLTRLANPEPKLPQPKIPKRPEQPLWIDEPDDDDWTSLEVEPSVATIPVKQVTVNETTQLPLEVKAIEENATAGSPPSEEIIPDESADIQFMSPSDLAAQAVRDFLNLQHPEKKDIQRTFEVILQGGKASIVNDHWDEVPPLKTETVTTSTSTTMKPQTLYVPPPLVKPPDVQKWAGTGKTQVVPNVAPRAPRYPLFKPHENNPWQFSQFNPMQNKGRQDSVASQPILSTRTNEGRSRFNYGISDRGILGNKRFQPQPLLPNKPLTISRQPVPSPSQSEYEETIEIPDAPKPLQLETRAKPEVKHELKFVVTAKDSTELKAMQEYMASFRKVQQEEEVDSEEAVLEDASTEDEGTPQQEQTPGRSRFVPSTGVFPTQSYYANQRQYGTNRKYKRQDGEAPELEKYVCSLNTAVGKETCEFSCILRGHGVKCSGTYCYCTKPHQIKGQRALCGSNTSYGLNACRNICPNMEFISCDETDCYCPVEGRKSDDVSVEDTSDMETFKVNTFNNYVYCGPSNRFKLCRDFCAGWGHVTCAEGRCYCDRSAYTDF